MAHAKARNKKSAVKAHRVAQRKPGPQGASNQAIVVAAKHKPWLLAPEEVTILKNAVCKGATDEELKYCLAVARRYEFDPFQKQIWFVKRWDSQAEQSDGKKGGYIWVPVVSIDGLKYQAASHHSDYGSISEAEYGPMIDVSWRDKSGKTQTFKAPEWARVSAWRKGSDKPTTGTVWWSEIYPDVDNAPLVRRMPRLMLAKCATAQAIRSAYPKKTGGLLIPEETQNREFTQFTPGGRIYNVEENSQESYLEKFEERQKKAIEALPPEAQEQIRKMRERSQKVQEEMRPVKSLFYIYHKESETYEIDGPQDLKEAHRELLAPLWNGAVKKIVATPADIGRLLSRFEDLKVPFKELQRP